MKKILLLTVAFGFFISSLTVATGCGSDKDQLNNEAEDTENGAPVDNIASHTQEVSPEPELPDNQLTDNQLSDTPTQSNPPEGNKDAIASGRDTLEDIAMVRHTPAVDHCDAYMIYIDEPKRKRWYKPDNLSKEFEEDSLKVNVSYYITEQTHNCGFGGYKPVIHIINIEKQQ